MLAIWHSWARPFVGIILPMFFALSGFLVAGSLERNKSPISFFGLRIIRLAPALLVEITLSAIILGPIFTTFSIQAYFSDPLFYSYFLNVVGYIHYTLPGVFTQNPVPSIVNSQLWTIPFELKCYIMLAGIAGIGIFGRKNLLLAFMVVAQIAAAAYVIIFTPPPPPMMRGNSSCRMLPGRPDHVQIPRSPALEWKSRCSECDCNHCPAFDSIWGLFYFRPIRLSYGIPRFMQSCPECISSGRGLLVRDVSLWLPAATSIHRFGFLDASLVVKHDRGLSDLFRFRSVFMVVHRKAGSKS